MDASLELRRQRDAIRHEMEQLVRTMQRLEPDVDQKRPGWESKRDELAQHRQRLSELRGKMRSVMDAAASATSNQTAPSYTPGSRQPTVLFPNSHAPVSAAHVSPLRRSSVSPPREPSPRRHASSTFASGGGSAAQQLGELSAIHRDEKQRLSEEIARISEAMDRRHAQERSELENRLQQEEMHLREYEVARQRMEEAQRHLEALKRTGSAGTASRGSIPELESLLRH